MMGPEALFVPYKISIADILVVMRDELPHGYDIDVSCVVLEILHNVFFDRVGQYGQYQGAVGVYRQLIPVRITDEEAFEIDVKMNEFQSLLVDCISGYFPQMAMQPHNHYFYYPAGETDLVIYAPVTEDLPPEISSKAVHEHAIRSALR